MTQERELARVGRQKSILRKPGNHTKHENRICWGNISLKEIESSSKNEEGSYK